MLCQHLFCNFNGPSGNAALARTAEWGEDRIRVSGISRKNLTSPVVVDIDDLQTVTPAITSWLLRFRALLPGKTALAVAEKKIEKPVHVSRDQVRRSIAIYISTIERS